VYGKPVIACCAFAICCASQAQEPAVELAKPPGDARHFVIESAAAKHGDSWSWTSADGSRMGRESMNVSGQIWDSDYTATTGTDGTPSSLSIRGFTPKGDAAESFGIANGSAHWKSPLDAARCDMQAMNFIFPKVVRLIRPAGCSSACCSARATHSICCRAAERTPLRWAALKWVTALRRGRLSIYGE